MILDACKLVVHELILKYVVKNENGLIVIKPFPP